MGGVARLPGEVEEHVLASDELAHAVLVADVGDIDRDVFLDSADVEEVAAVLGDQGVDQHDLSGAQGQETPGQVAPNESQAAGDENAEPTESLSRHRAAPLPRQGRARPGPRPAGSR